MFNSLKEPESSSVKKGPWNHGPCIISAVRDFHTGTF